MSRTMTPAAESAMAASQVRALLFVEMDFPSGFLRVNNSAITVAWNGYDWLGVGRLGSIDAISEGIALEARGLAFRISGVPPEHVSIALGTQYQGRDCKVWFAPLTEDHVPIADPVLAFHGRLDVMDIELGASATITVSAESRLADWDRPRVRRYNAEDQAIDDPTDKGFEFVPQMVEKELRWGY
jgi:hypothetical protein